MPPVPPNPIIVAIPLVVAGVIVLLALVGYAGLARRLDRIIALLDRRPDSN